MLGGVHQRQATGDGYPRIGVESNCRLSLGSIAYAQSRKARVVGVGQFDEELQSPKRAGTLGKANAPIHLPRVEQAFRIVRSM